MKDYRIYRYDMRHLN